jgi:hypothetical protein
MERPKSPKELQKKTPAPTPIAPEAEKDDHSTAQHSPRTETQEPSQQNEESGTYDHWAPPKNQFAKVHELKSLCLSCLLCSTF